MIDDLPVTVQLAPPLGPEVAAWVERDLGWQVVEHDGPLPPALALADAPCGVSWIAVTDRTLDDGAVRALLGRGAEDVVAWPDDRERIPLIATRVDVRRQDTVAGPSVVVAGLAGGVGTSTIALAVGGLLAWRGASVLVVGDEGLLALAGVADDATTAHVPVAGVDGLSVAPRGADGAALVWAGDLTVVDAGTRAPMGATLVVARADVTLRRAGRVSCPVVLNGDRPGPVRDAARLLDRPPVAVLPHSARVARAGLQGRVPTALPGRWLGLVGDALRRLDGAPR